MSYCCICICILRVLPLVRRGRLGRNWLVQLWVTTLLELLGNNHHRRHHRRVHRYDHQVYIDCKYILVVYFFQAGALFSHSKRKIWPFLACLAILSQIYALFGALFTGLDSAVLPKNWQISGSAVNSVEHTNSSGSYEFSTSNSISGCIFGSDSLYTKNEPLPVPPILINYPDSYLQNFLWWFSIARFLGPQRSLIKFTSSLSSSGCGCHEKGH